MPNKHFGWVTAVGVICFCLSSAALAEDCKPSDPDAFLPLHGRTHPPTNALPAPPTDNDCAFYNWAWHAFLFVTEKGSERKAAFLNYPTIERAFPKIFKPQARSSPALSVRNIEPALNETRSRHPDLTEKAGDPLPVLTDGVMQASQSGPGFGAILVDQNRNPIFYTIHVNNEFAKFVQDNGLDEIDRLLANPANTNTDELKKQRPVPAELEFRPGVMELKSAWMVIEGPVGAYSNYIVTRAMVPYLKNVGTSVVIDNTRPFREVNVALLSLHVVGVIDGHPEFIWATFEHADAQGKRDIAPAASANPTASSPTPPIDGAAKSYPLFHANTPPAQANDPTPHPIGADQKFASATSVYRVFPGSKSTQDKDADNRAPFEDPAVFTLNEHMTELFKARDPYKKDWRRNYRLVGAVWINEPRKDFTVGQSFGDDDGRLAGENRLSNMAMESFTQNPGNGNPHCFSCHDTSALIGLPGGKHLPPRLINVSHILAIAATKALSGK